VWCSIRVESGHDRERESESERMRQRYTTVDEWVW